MDDATALMEIEAIKQLKARCCRYLDTKDWTAWRGLFADDFLAFTRKGVGNRATAHQVHAPEIELTSPTTARGIWALEDVVRLAPGSTCAVTATIRRPTRRSTASGASPVRR